MGWRHCCPARAASSAKTSSRSSPAQAQRQLNRGEFRHKLARRLFFANQGAFQTGDYEIMNKASCLSLLCNAVLVWNTVHMS
ncbi:MAG TPA: Tn3 family transposase, partial [Candidatus Saccharimonadia bacterium]|nr:Tn3 family transposase [Candidatus Saccharimonadia bacterium]